MKRERKPNEKKMPVPGRQHARITTIDRRTIYYPDGSVQHRYPARMGYHGTDEEKNLNPEE